MAHQPSSTGDTDNFHTSAAQAELLLSVLDSAGYPWSPADVAPAREAELEGAGQALEISDEAAEKGWQSLSAQLNILWGAGENASVVALLQQKFAGRLPAAVVAHISTQAQQAVRSGQPMLGQMVACVQDMLANLAEADLQVMARPMAMAMRGNSTDDFIEATIQSVRKADWEALSPIEQARLSLAAARYAIAQSQNSD
ncbi:MAG: hypothetical protein WA885_18155 [Phormidesmis sp.]